MAAFICLALIAVSCGSSPSDSEKDFDLESLNAALAQELTAVDAYTRGLPLLRGRLRAVGREFRAQELEYVDAITKAIRGLGGEADAEPTELDFSEVKGQADFLALAYGLENAAFNFYTEASPQLYTVAPRILATTLAAGHAQHLVVLRQGLGAALVEAAPEAFESGEAPAPGATTPSGTTG
ncbi:MAG TPA: ferritin-like domain-containing protein [Solirubrobacterales bacterium]|jgi:bacterioferritin (cytochrome b1)